MVTTPFHISGRFGPVSAQDTPGPSSPHKEIYSPEGQRAGIRDRDRSIEHKGEGEENQEKDIFPGGTKDFLWIEKKQMWSTGKCKPMKVKGETHVFG